MRCFAVEMTRRLPYSASLLNAVLAVSARHLSVIGTYDPMASDLYHQRCLEYLIPALSESGVNMNEDILVATVILRLRAEFEGKIERPVLATADS